MPEILLPNNWQPRDYQANLWGALEAGKKRAVAVWHRRAGKDDVCLHWTATSLMERVGTYWHMLPEATQARKAVWDAINPHTGKRRIDEAFPVALRETTRENEMFIKFKNGSTWQVVGSDNFDSLVGSPPVGVVFSEWALADPSAWAYIRPILKENGGWALFIYTPRGRNHGATFYEAAKSDPEWFAELLPATKTGVFSQTDLDQEKAEYIREYGQDDGEGRFRQEYLCDFQAGVIGAYYTREMAAADEEGRIKALRADPVVRVHTAWDLGNRDSTAIWMFQIIGGETRCLDFLESSGVGLEWYVRELNERANKRGWVWGDDILPHDAEGLESQDKTRNQILQSLGRSTIVLPNARIHDGISAARATLRNTWFDAENCKRGIEALRQYRKEWDDKRKVFHDRPLHDWASHPADAYRYLALGIDRVSRDGWSKPIAYPKKTGIV